MTASAEKSHRGSPLTHAHAELKGAKYVVCVDRSRRYVDCTDDVCELLGYSRQEMLGKRIEDISYDVNLVQKLFADYVQSGAQQGDYILRRRNLTPLPIRYRAFVFDDGCHAAIWELVPGWKEPYLAALLETDPALQKEKIEHALAAIREKIDAPADERRLMNDAVSMLRALQKANAAGS